MLTTVTLSFCLGSVLVAAMAAGEIKVNRGWQLGLVHRLASGAPQEVEMRKTHQPVSTDHLGVRGA